MAYSIENMENTDTVYMVMTDRFFDGDPTNNGTPGAEYQPGNLHFYQGGDWAGLRRKLPYIKALGFSAVWMSPPQDNELYSRTGDEAGYHGYYTRDFNSPNPHFGTAEELQALLCEAERLGIKMILDVQLNHTADYLAYPSRQYDPPEYRPAPPFDNPSWYHNTPNIWNFADPQEAQNYSLGGLDDLAQENPACWQALLDAYWKPETGTGWFSYGFSGSRLDAVVEIPPEYLERFEKHTGKHSFGEAFTGSAEENAAFQQYIWGMLDYPLYFQLHNALCRGEDWGGVSRLLQKDGLYRDPCCLFTFLDNHDRARFLTNCADNISLLHLALALLYALRGIPVVYYGTEQHMAGDFRFTEQMLNDTNREMMPAFSSENRTAALLRRLNGIRRDLAAIFAQGTQREMYFRPGDSVYAFRRDAVDGRYSLCIFNKSAAAQTRTVFTGEPGRVEYVDLLDTRQHYVSDGGELTLFLPAYAAILLSPEAAGEYVPALPEKTRIVIHYDTGFGNGLTIRGDTSPLRWDFGQCCENKNADTWVFETERPKDGELRFKVLLNDAVWERGEDHRAAVGRETHIFPSFW